MTSNRFFVKLSGGKRGINLDLITDWVMDSDGILLVNFGGGVSSPGIVVAGKEAQQLLQVLITLSLDIDSFNGSN